MKWSPARAAARRAPPRGPRAPRGAARCRPGRRAPSPPRPPPAGVARRRRPPPAAAACVALERRRGALPPAAAGPEPAACPCGRRAPPPQAPRRHDPPQRLLLPRQARLHPAPPRHAISSTAAQRALSSRAHAQALAVPDEVHDARTSGTQRLRHGERAARSGGDCGHRQ
ncbi:Protein of unknown function, partial [Gryllus bimaculatus]